MERLRAFNYEFNSLDELDQIVKDLNIDLNNEISQATNEIPFKRFNNEKEYLRKLPNDDIIASYIEPKSIKRVVSNEALITFNNRKYSVNPKYVGKTVTISISDDTLEIYYNKEIIKSHKITSRK